MTRIIPARFEFLKGNVEEKSILFLCLSGLPHTDQLSFRNFHLSLAVQKPLNRSRECFGEVDDYSV